MLRSFITLFTVDCASNAVHVVSTKRLPFLVRHVVCGKVIQDWDTKEVNTRNDSLDFSSKQFPALIFSSTYICMGCMGRYNHSLSLDATIMASKTARSYVTMATVKRPKTPLIAVLRAFNSKTERWNCFCYQLLISMIRCNFWQSLNNSVYRVQSHLKFSKN